MTAQCVRCAKPMADQAYVCRADAQSLADDLLKAAGHAEDAEAVIARQVRYGNGGQGESGDGSHDPDLIAARRLGAFRNTIGTWARVVTEETGRQPRWRPMAGPLCPHAIGPCDHDSCASIRRRLPGPALSLETAWLSRRVDFLRKHPAAGEAFRELHDACSQLERLVDRPVENRHLVGICDCGKVLYAPWDWTVIQCKERNCGATWNLSDGQDILLRHLDDKLMTASEATRLAGHLDAERTQDGIRKLIDKWAQRSEILAHGQVMREPTAAELKADPELTEVAVPTYRFGEIRNRLAATPRRNRQAAA